MRDRDPGEYAIATPATPGGTQELTPEGTQGGAQNDGAQGQEQIREFRRLMDKADRNYRKLIEQIADIDRDVHKKLIDGVRELGGATGKEAGRIVQAVTRQRERIDELESRAIDADGRSKESEGEAKKLKEEMQELKR